MSHLSSFIQLLLDFFIISSDFDLAQHFSCSVKTVERGQTFLLACQQLQKKVFLNFFCSRGGRGRRTLLMDFHPYCQETFIFYPR